MGALKTMAGNFDNDYKLAISLRGEWKFSIGDDMQWANPTFNDSDWETVRVPSSWENQGFPGYDGYAWYRKQVTIGDQYKNSSLVLSLGYIDDVDEVFFNGVKIGHKGAFPPNYWTAYNAERKYIIPVELIYYNQPNVIAVRVYDSQIEGGIVNGNIAIFARQYGLPLDVNLEGYWKFKPGDDLAWMDPKFDDSKWKKLYVPAYWEDQVSASYDGYGWYRKTFIADPLMKNNKYVLILGKIDDWDEVYLNGKLVGQTGKISMNPNHERPWDDCKRDRYYYLSPGDIIPGRENVISVRVYDSGGEGGIYQGPVGLVELKKFVSYWREKK